MSKDDYSADDFLKDTEEYGADDFLKDTEGYGEEAVAVDPEPLGIQAVSSVPTGYQQVQGRAPTPEEVSVGAGSFVQGASLGLYDRLKSALGDKTYKDVYEERAQDQEKFPEISTAFEAAGTAASTALPGGAAKGIIKTGLVGAGLGGLEAAAKAAPDQDVVDEGLEGAALGAGVGAGAGLLGRLGKAVVGRSAVRDAAETQAGKALGLDKGALRNKLRKIDPTGNKKDELVRFAKDEGILRSGASSTKMFDKTKDLQGDIGSELGEILKDGSPIEINPLVKRLRNKAEEAASNLDDSVAKNIHEYADGLESLTTTGPLKSSRSLGPRQSQTTINPEQLRELKTRLGKKVKDFTKDSDIIEARKESYGILSDSIEESLPEAQKLRLRELNDKYTKTKHLEEGITGKVNQDESADLFNWQNVMLGTAGHPAAPVVKELVRSHGRSFAAIGVRKPEAILSNPKWVEVYRKAVEKVSGAAGIGAAHQQLMQTDEEYRKKWREEKGKGE